MKYEAKPPAEPKTTTRVVIETIIWIASAIISLYYVTIYARSSIAYYLVESFWITMLGFFVYDDSRRRYLKPSWNISWAIATGAFFPLFIIYYFIRPPVTLEITKTRLGNKLKFLPIGFFLSLITISLASDLLFYIALPLSLLFLFFGLVKYLITLSIRIKNKIKEQK